MQSNSFIFDIASIVELACKKRPIMGLLLKNSTRSLDPSPKKMCGVFDCSSMRDRLSLLAPPLDSLRIRSDAQLGSRSSSISVCLVLLSGFSISLNRWGFKSLFLNLFLVIRVRNLVDN